MASRCMQCLQINRIIVAKCSPTCCPCHTGTSRCLRRLRNRKWFRKQRILKRSQKAFDRIQFMHLIISDLTLSSRQRLRQTWPSQLLDIWSGTTCWQIPKCRPGPTWSFWESILPDWNAVRSCPLRNTLLSQLWCSMIYASTNGHMDTWPPNYQKTKTFFVLSSGWKMIHDFMRCNVEARIHPLGWSSWWQGLWTETQGLCFFSMWHWKWFGMFAVQEIQIFDCICVCVVLLLRLLAMSRIFFVLFLWMQHEMAMRTSPCARKAL